MSNKKKDETNKIEIDGEDLMDDVNKMIYESRNIILSLLIFLKYNDDEAERIEHSIFVSTTSELHQRYIYKKPFVDLAEFMGKKINSKYSKLLETYPDFFNFAWISLMIPFYHSLGDTIGYYNGNWEFNYGEPKAGPDYVNELIYDYFFLGGVNDLSIKNWMASDDTILYIDTMYALHDTFDDINSYINLPLDKDKLTRINNMLEISDENIDKFANILKNYYILSLPYIMNRDPGALTKNSLGKQKNIEWDKLPYDADAIGNGSAMRCGCIGFFYPGRHNRKTLVQLAVESSRITHNSTIAILGSVTAALFTAYSIEKVPIHRWPRKLIKLLNSNIVDEYMEKSRPHEYKLYTSDKILYIGQWDKYMRLLMSATGPRDDMRFMKNPVQRYKYLMENFSKNCDIPGSCGDDCLIYAYDSMLRCDGSFEKLIVYSILHPGDSDTIGAISFGWYGAFYHSPRNEYLIGYRFEELEFHTALYKFMEENITKMLKVYFFDIYLDTARRYLYQYQKK